MGTPWRDLPERFGGWCNSDVGMRVKGIVRRIDDFGAFQGHVLSDLQVHRRK
jgi:hypothetical protein